MQTLDPATHKSFPIQELEQIESLMAHSQKWLATLELRRAALSVELEKITRPEAITDKKSEKIILRGIEYFGVVYEYWNNIDLYFDLLKKIWIKFPERREIMAQSIARQGRKRPYVAKDPVELFPGQPIEFVVKHSRKLIDDWYVDTNLNTNSKRIILRAAIAAAGLNMGTDIKIYWRRIAIPVERLA